MHNRIICGLLTIIIVLVTCSCNERLNEVKGFYDDGTLQRIYFIDRDSLIQGEYKVFFEDGETLFEVSHYSNGQLDGERTLFYIDGVPEIKEYYSKDTLIDTTKIYYKNGNLKQLVPHNKGVLSGILRVFYDNGNLKEEVMFEDNQENGPFKEYHPNGQLKWTGTYLNGDNEFGELRNYDSTGTHVRTLVCDSLAICRTTWAIEDNES